MKKYCLMDLYVVTVGDNKYICQRIFRANEFREFKEVFTGMIIQVKDNYTIQKMVPRYYNIIDENFQARPLYLSKEELLDEFININTCRSADFLLERAELRNLIDRASGNPDMFYRRICEELTPEEREDIKSKINKSCETCTNQSCRIETDEKIGLDETGKPQGNSCMGWKNDQLIGEYRVLYLTKK